MGGVTGQAGPNRQAFSAPAPLQREHDISGFTCGKPALDDWLRHRALKNEGRGSRTYVVCQGERVVAYYCLASGSTQRANVPGRLSRNMPDPLPVLVLGRLAVHADFHGCGLGRGMLKDAILRAAQANRIAGFRTSAVHALDDDALASYAKFGFVEHPLGTRTLFLPIETFVSGL